MDEMGKLRKENAELKRRIAEFERKEKICLQTESELARKNAELEAILNAPRDSVILFDKKNRILDCNKTFTQSSGLRKEDIIVKFSTDFYPPEIREEREKLFEKVFETGEPIEFIDERDGKYFDVSLHPVPDEKGEAVKAASIARDVTRLKKTELELQKNSAFLEAVFEGMPGMALIVDGNHKILNCNDRFFKTVAEIGFDSKKEIIGKTCHRILKNLDAPCPHCKIHEAFDSGKEIFISLDEDSNRIAKGAFDVWYRPILDGDGNVIAALEISFDVTEKRKVRNALVSFNKELQKMAAARDKLLSVIAHDLRSPVAGLSALTREMHENLDSIEREELSEMVAALSESSSNLYKLLDNLLHWAKLSGKALQLKPEKRNVSAIIQNNLDVVKIQITRKKITIDNGVDPNLHLDVDPNMFDAVIRNLLSNSVKYCKKNGRIKISNQILPEKTIIEIEDDGVGMTREILDNIFDVINTTSETGTSGERGSGLGLVLCREFMKMHGGDIEIESAPGKGSKASLVFPD